MKKRTKILLVVMAALLCILAALAYWQRNNLNALFLSMKHSREDLTAQMDTGRKELEEKAGSATAKPVQGLTEEQKHALHDETMSRDEIIDQMVSGTAVENTPQDTDIPTKSDTAEPTPPAKPEGPTQEELDRDQLARCIAEIYVMEEEYTKWLEDAYQKAIAEFNALPKEKQTSQNKYSIGMKYMNQGLDKEKECDGQMAELENKIRDLLVRLGDSTDLVDQIHKTYEDEKALKKAYYLGLHS